MDLMTLAAKITLDDKQFTQGVGKAEKMGQQLAGKMSAMTVAAGNLAADMVRKGVQAISSVISGAIDGYANYQQLIGGVETLFKTSASKVSAYAKQSYKTTGLSANQYMETVTSFSASLLQGLQGDTDKAADMANMAVTDMADNANKMGTDIGSIQNAYQGFAKQNFTMLDNLKLGYGGTREEMVRLVNESGILDHKISDLDGITFDQLVQAIHKIQEEMGITGTTASEAAETISGSKASLSAAWQDLLSAVGGEGDGTTLDDAIEKFKTSFSGYMENFVPTLVKTVANSGTLVEGIADAISSLPTTLLGEIGEEAMGSGADMMRGASKIVNWLIDSIGDLFSKAAKNEQGAIDLGAAIGEFIGSGIQHIVTNAGDILTGIIAVGKGLAEGLVTGLFQGLFGDDAEAQSVMDEMNDTIKETEKNAAQNDALIKYLEGLAAQYGNAASETLAWKSAAAELEQSMPGATKVFEDFSGDVNAAVTSLKAMNEQMRRAAIEGALTEALAEERRLQTTQRLEYNKQNVRYNMNKDLQDTYMENIREGIKQSAANLAEEMWNQNHDENGNLYAGADFDENYYNEMQELAKGNAWLGDAWGTLEDLDFSGLQSIISELTDENLQTLFDNNTELYKQAQAEMDSANEAMKNLSTELEATEKAIALTEAAQLKTAEEMLGTSQTINEGSTSVGTALDGLAKEISGFKMPHNYVPYMPEATGMDYVPYTGFKAELHRGEAVLTKAEADRYRNGSGTAEVVGAIQSLNSNIQNMQLVVGQKAFGRAVVGNGGGRMNNYIGQAESRRASGYGT